jgi:antitoxin component YwqK of YwqJK toxin-antitoxin module
MFRNINFSFIVLIIACLFSACQKSSAPVSADLTGYTVNPIPGSAFSHAVMMKDTVKFQEGYVLNGTKSGQWVEYHPDGRIAVIQNFIDGKLNGPMLNLDNRGQITAMTTYRDGTLHGMKATYKFGKPLEEVPYDQGKISGVMRKYYDSSNSFKIMEEAEYKDNKQNGIYRHYNEQGAIDLEYVYRNGEKVSGGIVTPPDTTR